MNIFSWFGAKPKPWKLETKETTPIYDFVEKKGKIALVLGGGGSFGRFEIGVLKYMADLGLLNKVDMIVGTSVGALNALFTARFWNEFDKVVDIWTTRVIKNTDIYSGEVPRNLGGVLSRATGFLFGNKSSLVKPTGLYNILNEYLQDKCFIDLPIPTYITATDVRASKRIVFCEEHTPFFKCQVAGRASSAIPVIFPHVVNDGQVLCDGGIANNTPVEVAVEHGADKIILIGCTPDNMPLPEIKDDMIIDGIQSLATALHLAEEDNWDIVESGNIPYIGLFPSDMKRMGKSILDFDNFDCMQYGYDIAVKYLTDEKIRNFLTL